MEAIECQDCSANSNSSCPEINTFWIVFTILGLLSIVTAFGQSIFQVYALRISVEYDVIHYIWFFIIATWLTLIYLIYTARLLYLVRFKRCSELSKFWWYYTMMVFLLNPAQTAWWWFSQDYIMAYVSTASTIIYFLFFTVVWHSIAPIKLKRQNENSLTLHIETEI